MKQIFGALVLACIVWATPSLADPGRGTTVLCYLKADQPTLDTPYTPDPLYSFNAQNRDDGISVTRTGTGKYIVVCTGVGGGSAWGDGGHVQVSPYGDGNTFCRVESWNASSADFTATVSCFGRGGDGGGTGPQAADSAFTLLFIW